MSIKQSNVHWICDCVSSDRESFGRMVFFELDESWSVDQLIKERHLQETLEFDAPIQTLSTASNDKLERLSGKSGWHRRLLYVLATALSDCGVWPFSNLQVYWQVKLSYTLQCQIQYRYDSRHRGRLRLKMACRKRTVLSLAIDLLRSIDVNSSCSVFSLLFV